MPYVEAQFEIEDWDESTYDEPARGPKLSRATVHKAFSGEVEGTSVAELVTCRAEGGEAYAAIERVEASVEGRAGSFVIQHGALRGDDSEGHSFGAIVPGSGTGELTGISGEASFAHDESGASLTLDYELPAQ